MNENFSKTNLIAQLVANRSTLNNDIDEFKKGLSSYEAELLEKAISDFNTSVEIIRLVLTDN